MTKMPKQKFTGSIVLATVAAFLVLQLFAITHSHDDENHDDDHHCGWCVHLQQSKQLLHIALVFSIDTGAFEDPSGVSQVCCAYPDIPAARSRSPPT